ncbi:MAG: T9SS type A sorting domain-containing protein [candidate division WOR-3 bacterium]|nr:MAG: T9SS type A sorting domain-containing protein [candidate division WOR-3 bacterium]
MYILQSIVKYFSVLLICGAVCLHGQDIYFVANSDSPIATAYNNSHKIAPKYEEYQNDTVYLVFQSSDSIYFVWTANQGISWTAPIPVSEGAFPAIDICPLGFRHLAWQSPSGEIYYDCLDDWSPPINVSNSSEQSSLPDLVVDSNNVKHIVWVENISGRDQIFYRTVANGMLGDTACISGFGSTLAVYNHPGISIFAPNNRIYAIWDCLDSLCYSPHQIHLRYLENEIWSAPRVWAHYLPMRHPSIDYSHGQPQDTLSFGYEDSTTGTMQASFYGGNGGGHPTQGYSTYPVVSTVGPTWSYLLWQEDSAGTSCIFYSLYYSYSGWVHGVLNTQEPARFPNVCGAYAVWTQGDSAPYSIYFADFGYPIGIQENVTASRINILTRPNPFSQKTDIRYQIADNYKNVRVSIYDASGRLVRTFNELPSDIGNPSSVIWFGDDDSGKELPAGVYLCCVSAENQTAIKNVIKAD